MDYYASVDKRLHIAAGEYYQGSINSYNNLFTKLLFWGKSRKITINGESFRVNKKSYDKFLISLKADLPTAKLSKEFVGLPVTVLRDRGQMRSHLRAFKTRRLGQKLIHALVVEKDMQLAKKYIGQGAAVDKHFWLLEDHVNPRICLNTHFSEDLAQKTLQPFTSTRYTPYLFAIASSQFAVRDFLEKVGVNREMKGEICTFSRTITQCTNQVRIDPTVRTHVHVSPRRRRQRRAAPHVTHSVGVDVVNTQTIYFQDVYANRSQISANLNGQNLVFTPSMNGQDVVNWSTSTQVGRVPIL